ncbi:40S ribosomal protein S5-1 [Hordeum vulgare]|nr:40S ribosomal protein S5-1 [Hordeum vulgare]
MTSPKAPKDKIFERVINPYLIEVLQHPQSIKMSEGMLHIHDVEGPKKTGSMETRLEAMEQQVFKCQGMVEHGLNANHMMITEFTNNHNMDDIDIGKQLSRLYDRVDQLQDPIYDLQNQNLRIQGGNGFEILKEKEPTVNEKLGHDSARIGKLEDVITNLGSAFATVQNTPNFSHNKITKSVFVPKSSGVLSSKKDENLKIISDHATYGLSTKDDDT